MGEYAIEVEGLGVRFRRNRRGGRSIKAMFADASRRTPKGEFWALRDITFNVRPGESIGVVGRNGQGKSTLLKLVAGVLLADEGTVTVHDGVAPLIEITGGFVGDLTVRENVRLTAGLHGMGKAEVAKPLRRHHRVRRARGRSRHPVQAPLQWNEGATWRSLWSRSSISRSSSSTKCSPSVTRRFREKCYRRIEEMLADGRTLFFVSHNERDLKRFCTRGLYIREHRLVMDDAIDEVLKTYNADNAAN